MKFSLVLESSLLTSYANNPDIHGFEFLIKMITDTFELVYKSFGDVW